MKIVTVIPLKKGPLREDLTYFTSKEVLPGSIVTIPLRNKKILGLVVSAENVSDSKVDIKDMNFNLRKIEDVKENSIFLKEYLESVMDISKYSVASKNNTITSLIPAIFREKYDDISTSKTTLLSATEKQIKKIKAEKFVFQAPTEDRIASYRTLIRESFALKKSVFMILPNERDIKTFHKIISRGIEQFTFEIYGGISTKKLISKFKEIVSTEHPVLIIGTAPFLSIPRVDIGTIILEHESSNGYKTITDPHLDLRIFAELFATKINARLILSDTLLRFETIGRTETDALVPLHPLSYRTNFEGEIIIPQRGEKFQVLTEESIHEIKNLLEKKKNIFIFSLRKGLATETICRDCNETLSCDVCSAPVVLYLSRDEKKRIFSCNRCKKRLDAETKCVNCGSWNLMPLGIGTDTVFEEVERLFPEEKIFKIDKEIAKNAKEAEKIVKDFEETKGSILIGTEMAFTYIKETVPLSIIASFDSLWSIPNFKIGEKIVQIMLKMVEKTSTKIIIQTKNENDPAILAFKDQNLLSFVREELKDRKNLGYPPYKRFIKISYMGDKEQTGRAREFVAEILKEYNPEIFSGFVAKSIGKYTTNVLIKTEPQNWSLPELTGNGSIDQNLFAKISSLQPSFDIFVDPEDLL